MDNKRDIVIIEDNADIREGFKLLINSTSNYHVSDTFEKCELAFNRIKSSPPHIILMDIDLPGMNGIEGSRKIKALHPKIEIIIITVFENSNRVFDALCAGATGYLTKNSSHVQLLSALDEVMQGGSPMSANIARMVASSFHKNLKSPLSEREHEVLSLLSDGKSYKSISDLLFISLATVKFHIKNIYIKLQVSSKEDAISTARDKKFI
jgi:DNA-binding NarL/FixJ family response regulator